MIYCANCGSSLFDDDIFCSECGAKNVVAETAATLTAIESTPVQDVQEEYDNSFSTSETESGLSLEPDPVLEEASPVLLATKTCNNCGKEMAEDAEVCIHCGHPITKFEKEEDVSSIQKVNHKTEEIVQEIQQNDAGDIQKNLNLPVERPVSTTSPEDLDKIVDNFLAIESNYNSKIKELRDEKTLIDDSYNNPLIFLSKQHQAIIAEKEKAFSEYSFAGPILSQKYSESLSNVSKASNAKIIFAIAGGIIFLAYSWKIGLIFGIISLICWQFELYYKKFVSLLVSSQKNSFSDEAIHHVIKNSDSLRVAIEKKAIEERQLIEKSKNELANIYASREKQAKIKYDRDLSVFKKKESAALSVLNNFTRKSIDTINAEMASIEYQLNQFPETFDHKLVNWSENTLIKGKDWVASNIRIGEDIISIDVNNKRQKLIIPRLMPFLNKTNLVFNCNNLDETKLAIRLSHNLIARTLLSLPASKVKLTFIDPLELGGNVSPFTPLLREIYGGMVFTQQNDIENQLSILTRAIENIIQRYLQDKFADIADYNLKTKEVPEPYRLLVVYNFPHGFNDTTATKLINIIKSGPKAGIHTILINDRNAKLPYGMDWKIFDSVNIQGIEIATAKSSHSSSEESIQEQAVEFSSVEPAVGNIYECIVKNILPFGVFVEFMPGKEGLIHISEVSDKRLESLDGVLKLGERLRAKLLGADPKSGKFKLSMKAVLEETIVSDKSTEQNTSEDNISESLFISNLTNQDKFKRSESKKIFKFDENLPYSEIVDYINKELPNSSILKVPFTKYIAPQTEWWQEKAHKRYAVPIGRHGTEVQSLKFDNDDDNQALMIGKPGSGKSNLLHVIIANSLWKYSPDQLEIYLIDFKGGVEFTVYADKKIPHIRTIAIESEREFGLSVLDGVEKELLRREMEFSKTGSQNIEQYHEKFPDLRMPRVLLIVDEFQEFFAEDDGIKQSVDDKFDRIVRKGRAFGINTLFSSQTLSGNSIKKSTKELIDIRIALMCSDLDATQILDDRNPGARDLARPGEAIYNPENGKIEGNKKFQAFFIEKEDLNRVIENVVSFANSNENTYKRDKQIIFRGSEKAYMEKDNHPLKNVSPVISPRSLKLWIGEPVAIANDVTAMLRKQGGANVLIAGYDESIGVRIMASLIVSAAIQHQPGNAKFYSFNNYNIDSDLVNIPDELFKNIQQTCKHVSNKEVKEILQSIKSEIERRLEGGNSNDPYYYLTFFAFQRGRAFRKDGYSMTEEGQLLSFILKEGPDVGIFSLLQVDTMDNFSKNLDDNLLKEFSQRIASQMNPDNSVKIIGNQKAAKLGSNRAWYYDDNENTMTKFKPYELPVSSWVIQLQNPQSTLS